MFQISLLKSGSSRSTVTPADIPGPLLYTRALVGFLLGLVTRTSWLGLGKHCGLAHNKSTLTPATLCTQSNLTTLES